MADKNDLMMIKANVENLVGKNVRVTANKGRKRTSIREGLLEKAYSNIFVVELKNEFNSTRKVSFNYTDILTEVVQIQECNADDIIGKINIDPTGTE